MSDPGGPAPRDPYAGHAKPPAAPSRAGCAVALVCLFLLGFVGVGAVLLLRAPDGPPAAEGTTLPGFLRAPEGYVPLADARSGGGRLDEARAATLLHRADVQGFRDGLLRAWGRPAGQPPRAVVVLAVEVDTPDRAAALAAGYAAAAAARGATPFATGGLDARAFHDAPDASGRHAQRVVLARGPRVFVVSVVTPERAADTAEVLALAARQSAAA